jgi:polyhydroxybutyrate depolymerase
MKHLKRILLAAFTLALLLNAASCSPFPGTDGSKGESIRFQVTVDDLERAYLLYTPSGFDDEQPIPVVFVFHGLGDSASNMQSGTNFNQIADQENFLVVYPEGVESSWNVAEEAYISHYSPDVDDRRFVRAILSNLSTAANVDPQRIYAVGFSMGGALVYRLACDMSDTFAAIAPIAGPMEHTPCTPAHAVSVLHIHGLSDQVIPFSGGGGYQTSPIEEAINTWGELNQCAGPAAEESLSAEISHTAYASCQSGASVELYTIATGGHTWPSKLEEEFAMPAAQFIWEFFAAHPKQ